MKLRKAQGSLEYAALIGIIVGAIILMSKYLKRSVIGRVRSSANEIGEQYDLEKGGYKTTSKLEEKAVTYSATGTVRDNVGMNNFVDWINPTVNSGKGEVQFTQEAGARTTTEQLSTDASKIK